MLPIDKLESLERRFDEVNQLLCDPALLSKRNELTKLNKERSDIEPVVAAFGRYKSLQAGLVESRAALDDPELKELAQAEVEETEAAIEALASELSMLLLPKDPNDERNTVVEVRAGTGGEEAALFAADVFRMISRYSEGKGYKVEIMNTSEASAGGYKEVIALISGKDVYSHLRYEAGVHRVQRVPATETQGRVHTSTATVAVMPEADEVDVAIRDEDLDISIAASGGPGGQGVNTTNSAVQIRHIPSGLIVKCQDERSQHKNKARAMTVLRSRLLEREQTRQQAEQTAERRTMVGSGERSEKIRTYNYPQNRVTDHRINLTLHKLESVVGGELDDLVGPLRAHRQATMLQETGDA
jgi:peptide chain release factor 1